MVKKTGSGNTRTPRSVTQLSHEDMRGRAAEKLLNDKTLNQALDDMREAAFVLIADSAMDQKQEREDLYLFVKTIDKLKKQLHVYINKGKGAGIQLKEVRNG